MIVIRFRSFRLIVNVSMWAQDGGRHPSPIGTFSLSYNGDILIKFRHTNRFALTEFIPNHYSVTTRQNLIWGGLVILLFLGALFWAKQQDPFSRRWFTLKTADHGSV